MASLLGVKIWSNGTACWGWAGEEQVEQVAVDVDVVDERLGRIDDDDGDVDDDGPLVVVVVMVLEASSIKTSKASHKQWWVPASASASVAPVGVEPGPEA